MLDLLKKNIREFLEKNHTSKCFKYAYLSLFQCLVTNYLKDYFYCLERV